MKKKCVQCGENFRLTESEINFYESKGLVIPKRCEACRKQNKKKRQGQKTSKSPLVMIATVLIAIIGYFLYIIYVRGYM